MALTRSWARVTILAAALVLGLCVPAVGATATQSLTLLQCQGTESDTYSPGLTFQPRNITITTDGQFTSCVDGAGQVTSGSYHEQFTIMASCDNLLEGFTTQRVFTWNTGDTSVLNGTGSSTAMGSQVITVITGTVTQGRFLGRTGVEVIPLPQPNLLQCLTTGVTSVLGATTLTIS